MKRFSRLPIRRWCRTISLTRSRKVMKTLTRTRMHKSVALTKKPSTSYGQVLRRQAEREQRRYEVRFTMQFRNAIKEQADTAAEVFDGRPESIDSVFQTNSQIETLLGELYNDVGVTFGQKLYDQIV